MARLLSDVLTVSVKLWDMFPGSTMKMMVASPIVTVLGTLACGFGNKAIRWITRDPTPYVGWYDLQGQIDRLAKERFDAIKGALAPAAIYDRMSIFFSPDIFNHSFSALNLLKEKGVIFLGGTGLLGIAALSIQDCNLVGDPANPFTSDQCWNQLGQHILEPMSLSLVSFGYAMSNMSAITMFLSIVPLASSLLIIQSVSNGFSSKSLPTFLRNKDILLAERYQDLATHFTDQWQKVSDGKNIEKIDRIVELARLIKQKSSMIRLALEVFFSLSEEESMRIIAPLLQAAKKIIVDAAKVEIKESIIIKKAE